MADTADLEKLAQKLVAEGPHEHKPSHRRVRALFNGKYVIDTLDAFHVWEHPYYPQLYVPTSSFKSEANFTKTSAVEGTNGQAHLAKLSVGNRTSERIVVFNKAPLDDLVKVDFEEMDQWFEEEVPIYKHPKDPYKRIDILHSTRNIKVGLRGVTLAESSSPLFLLETALRTRYYLPPTSVNWECLVPSTTETYCPYKGKANYYHVKIGDQTFNDLVWYYRYPTAESAAIAGHFCFYNEKVDVWVDGKREE